MYNPRNQKLMPHARSMRTQMTKEERHLWYDFLRYCSPRFRRQEIIGNYIADFYCSQAKLIIELDGSQHTQETAAEYDAARTAYFSTLGMKVIRFYNSDVNQNFSGVCQHILGVLEKEGFLPHLNIPE